MIYKGLMIITGSESPVVVVLSGRVEVWNLASLGFVPYLGWATILLNDNPIVKYILIGTLGCVINTLSLHRE
ncbi:hypothetical protein FRX31_023622 [Thalictrum thalictroides]|uniref:Signal peptidase complex catalytic subunit SEC11 n=1 Tax=Thalictrum thalictroides TaxID=46969 RepID=A0A7J6VNV9_THATH|nr:hypothetical protein FRX31_023622 [Thalictrum thalictroides]